MAFQTTKSKCVLAGTVIFAGLVGLFAKWPDSFPGGTLLIQKLTGKYTVADRVAEFGEVARLRWRRSFERAGVPYPPGRLLFLGLKQEKRLVVYAQREGRWVFVRGFRIEAASGKMGPKLAEGDFQVPEGIYPIASLNPNSAYHLSLRIGYPSAVDEEVAAREGRTGLGGDIMIHGGNGSVGCLAMGDEAAEDLFVLAAEVGVENIQVLLCPLDFRTADVPADAKRPEWVRKRYVELARLVHTLPRDSS